MTRLAIALAFLLLCAIVAYIARDRWDAWPVQGYVEPGFIERNY